MSKVNPGGRFYIIKFLYTGIFCMLFCHLLIFFKINFIKKSFRNTIRASTRLNQDSIGLMFNLFIIDEIEYGMID